MKPILLLVCFLLTASCIYCQKKKNNYGADSAIFEAANKTIETDFPGGKKGWAQFLRKNLHYPQDAIDNEVMGNVITSFDIDTTGHISNIKIEKDPGHGLGKEAERVLKLSDGMWIPTTENGSKINHTRKQPFVFIMETAG